MIKGTWKKEHKTFACIDAALTFLRKDYVYRRWDGDGIEKTWRSFLQNKMHRVLKNTVSLDVQDSNMWLKRVTHSCYLEGGQRGNQQLGRAQT